MWWCTALTSSRQATAAKSFPSKPLTTSPPDCTLTPATPKIPTTDQLVDKGGRCKDPFRGEMSYGVCSADSAASLSTQQRCIDSMEHIRWPLVQDEKPRKVAGGGVSPFKGASGALAGSAGPYHMASGATWYVQGGLEGSAERISDGVWCKLGPR